VFIPQAVLQELKHPHAPAAVRDWASDLPNWVEALNAPEELPVGFLPDLDRGEREALRLALDTNADLVLLDDNAAVYEALRLGLKVSRTISLLGDADEAGLLNFDEAIDELSTTNFRVEPDVIAEVRRRVRRKD
jgi:predicted nucleic acid-binding protein